MNYSVVSVTNMAHVNEFGNLVKGFIVFFFFFSISVPFLSDSTCLVTIALARLILA